MRKAVNTIFVKNFPLSWKAEELKQYFSKFGEVQSSYVDMEQAIKKPYGFVTFSQTKGDIEYGSACALKAIEEANDRKIEENGETFQLYVGLSIPKEERAK